MMIKERKHFLPDQQNLKVYDLKFCRKSNPICHVILAITDTWIGATHPEEFVVIKKLRVRYTQLHSVTQT